MDFKSQYKHPSWQKKRLEALSEAKFECENCGDAEEQLHVHHHKYIKGRAIWEYETSELAVLCESCHEQVHQDKKLLEALTGESFLSDVVALVGGYKEASGCSIPDADAVMGGSPLSFYAGRVAYLLAGMNVSFILQLQDKLPSMEKEWIASKKIGGFDA